MRRQTNPIPYKMDKGEMQVFRVRNSNQSATFNFNASEYKAFKYMSLVQCQMSNIFAPSGNLVISQYRTIYTFNIQYFPFSLQDLVNQLNNSSTIYKPYQTFFSLQIGVFQVSSDGLHILLQAFNADWIEATGTLAQLTGITSRVNIPSGQPIPSIVVRSLVSYTSDGHSIHNFPFQVFGTNDFSNCIVICMTWFQPTYVGTSISYGQQNFGQIAYQTGGYQNCQMLLLTNAIIGMNTVNFTDQLGDNGTTYTIQILQIAYGAGYDNANLVQGLGTSQPDITNTVTGPIINSAGGIMLDVLASQSDGITNDFCTIDSDYQNQGGTILYQLADNSVSPQGYFTTSYCLSSDDCSPNYDFNNGVGNSTDNYAYIATYITPFQYYFIDLPTPNFQILNAEYLQLKCVKCNGQKDVNSVFEKDVICVLSRNNGSLNYYDKNLSTQMQIDNNLLEFRIEDQNNQLFPYVDCCLEFILYDDEYLAIDEADEEIQDQFLQDYDEPK